MEGTVRVRNITLMRPGLTGIEGEVTRSHLKCLHQGRAHYAAGQIQPTSCFSDKTSLYPVCRSSLAAFTCHGQK